MAVAVVVVTVPGAITAHPDIDRTIALPGQDRHGFLLFLFRVGRGRRARTDTAEGRAQAVGEAVARQAAAVEHAGTGAGMHFARQLVEGGTRLAGRQRQHRVIERAVALAFHGIGNAGLVRRRGERGEGAAGDAAGERQVGLGGIIGHIGIEIGEVLRDRVEAAGQGATLEYGVGGSRDWRSSRRSSAVLGPAR